ncbi:NH(3)-dependent NAD(+) synthetase [anaerobic digester metagenome]
MYNNSNSINIMEEMLANREDLREDLCNFIRDTVLIQLKKRGVIIGISGGIDSAIVAALAVEGLGPDRVFGLILPEKESAPMSRQLALDLCHTLKIQHREISITPMLEKFGIYSEKESLINRIFPQYRPTIHSISLTRPSLMTDERILNIPSLELIENDTTICSKKLSSSHFFHLLSLQNVKQRTRMIVEYMHAEKMNYAVCGTTNKSELLLGFYVKYGDGGVDLEPIANCYKSQIYGLAELVDLDRRIIERIPSPDTWSYETSDEETALRLPYDILDTILYAEEKSLSIETIQNNTILSIPQIESAIKHIRSLQNSARMLKLPPPVYG